MYVRFITPWWRLRRGVDCGLFGPAYWLAGDDDVPALLRDALQAEIGWFEDHLPVPRPVTRAFCVRSKKSWRADGVCWFNDGAREAIARAFTLAALLRKCGIPARKVATRRPGTILYRDAWQIVAKPAAGTPTRWH
jgi:sulfur carrier protein ThiS